MKKNVIFVCTGNVCRSPMAEYFLKHRFGTDSDWNVSSCGLLAGRGLPATDAAIKVMDEKGIDIRNHASRPLSEELVDSASVILVMTQGHRDQMRALYPEATEKVFLLRSFDSLADTPDIEDPLGFSDAFYRQTRDQIDNTMSGLMEFLKHLKVDRQSWGRKPR